MIGFRARKSYAVKFGKCDQGSSKVCYSFFLRHVGAPLIGKLYSGGALWPLCPMRGYCSAHAVLAVGLRAVVGSCAGGMVKSEGL